MTKNRPRCLLCQGTTKKNGTTSKGTTRWRCTHCGYSFTRSTQKDHQQAATMRLFITWVTGTTSMKDIAHHKGISARTLHRRMSWCWRIIPPNPVDPHRVHDQIFLDATYLASGCLLIASSRTHIINWTWARSESKAAYIELITHITPPLMAVIDGGEGALTAIRHRWPTTTIQRCLVHAQRTVRRYTTLKPQTDAGKAIRGLSLKLTNIHTLEQAAQWTVHLHEFHQTYDRWMKQRTTYKDPATGQWRSEYTHQRIRWAYQSLQHLHKNNWLFAYLQPPPQALEPETFASTTNVLEGGFNAPLKEIARRHRGLTIPHQRTVIDWWLYLKTQAPDDPVTIARSQQWGQEALSKAHDLITHENTQATTNDHGAPAEYDTAIDTSYQHNLGVQKGWVR